MRVLLAIAAGALARRLNPDLGAMRRIIARRLRRDRFFYS